MDLWLVRPRFLCLGLTWPGSSLKTPRSKKRSTLAESALALGKNMHVYAKRRKAMTSQAKQSKAKHGNPKQRRAKQSSAQCKATQQMKAKQSKA